ncbi:hypothetical protein [Streptomyces sp. H27-H5]|uniref:hypothetical protein n=1 Tax=Streptomyces sp. H27-H5 TaxID=2996460 RepID=UPI00226E072B|nr:hypothetical protein [Streptomyces sp. H27-H5]MCY0957756.1 hypothetical protein [Streptomyces sp. H27-H5]
MSPPEGAVEITEAEYEAGSAAVVAGTEARREAESVALLDGRRADHDALIEAGLPAATAARLSGHVVKEPEPAATGRRTKAR